MALGRPTDYKPEFCLSVIEWGKLGKSKAWMCASLDITRPTMDRWIAEHDDFNYSMGLALNYSQMWWENVGQSGMQAKNIDGPIWSRSMAARFPADWREKTDNTTTINAGDGVAELFGMLKSTRSL